MSAVQAMREAPTLMPDQRDATPEPPAYLDPWWVKCMRERIRNYQATGSLEWYKQGPDWMPASRAPSADGVLNQQGGN